MEVQEDDKVNFLQKRMEKRHLRKDARFKRTGTCHAQSIPKEVWDKQALSGKTHTQEPVPCPTARAM